MNVPAARAAVAAVARKVLCHDRGPVPLFFFKAAVRPAVIERTLATLISKPELVPEPFEIVSGDGGLFRHPR